MGCTKLDDLMAKQRAVIERHIDEHKWCQHIEDRNTAVGDFIEKYGWIMREMFCSLCPDGIKCDYYGKHFKENSEADREYALMVMSL